MVLNVPSDKKEDDLHTDGNHYEQKCTSTNTIGLSQRFIQYKEVRGGDEVLVMVRLGLTQLQQTSKEVKILVRSDIAYHRSSSPYTARMHLKK